MPNIYNPYLSRSIFFRPEQMYGENRKILENLSHIVHGNIYFLAERRKVRVDPSSVGVSPDGFISVDFIVEDGRRLPSRFPFAATIIDLGEKKLFQKHYGDAHNLQRSVIGVKDHDEYLARYETQVPSLIGVSPNSLLQSKRNISLNIHTPDERIGNLPFSIHSILSTFEIDIGDFPRVLYIGKSEDLQDRIYRHEKIQEALSVVDDESDIYLYAFEFDASQVSINKKIGALSVMGRTAVTDISFEDQLSIIEMSLINYFKPKLNIDYKDAEIPSNPIFRRALSGKYDQVVLEVDHEGTFWNFGTANVPASLRHQITYDVRK